MGGICLVGVLGIIKKRSLAVDHLFTTSTGWMNEAIFLFVDNILNNWMIDWRTRLLFVMIDYYSFNFGKFSLADKIMKFDSLQNII